MILSIEWNNATRPKDEKVRVETTIKNDILDFFGGVENAKKAYDFYKRSPRTPFQDWARAVYHGYRSVKNIVTPTEYRRLSFTASFDEMEPRCVK